MTNEAQQHLNQITKKPRIYYLDVSNRDLAGNADLSEFANLTTFNSSNNQFESLEFLNSLPNKEKLKRINFFGNQLKEIDFAWLLSTFPNLEAINIENNPVKTKNLNNLTSEQFNRLVAGIKNKKFRIISWKGTILMDLLERAQALISQGNTTTQAHIAYLQTLTQPKSPQPKAEVKTTTPKDNQINTKNPNTNTFFLIGGLVLLIASVLAIGYWLGKRKKPTQEVQEY